MKNSFNILYSLFIYFLVSVSFSSTFSQSIVSPSPDITPLQVVEIQLFALQSNDPKSDLGILQTWEFAHPRNKNATGPYNKFAAMIRSPAYLILLNNKNFETKEISNDGSKAEVAVKIDSKENKFFAYLWTLEKINDGGEFNDSWMTVGVSFPIQLANGL